MNRVIENRKNNIPLLRFDVFNGAWKTIKLKNIVTFLRGASASRSDLKKYGKFSYIMYGELFSNYNEIIKDIKSRTDKDIEPKSKYGDILMPSSDVTPTGLATASAIFEDGVVLGGDINILRPTSSDYDSKFLSYLINYHKKDILRLVTGTTIRHIYISDIKNISYKIPLILEQKKIGDFLYHIDNYIENLKRQKESLILYKKSILQKIIFQKIRFKDDSNNNFREWEEKKIGDIFEVTRGYVLAVKDMKKKQQGEYIYPVFSSQTQNGGLIGFYNQYLYQDAITWTTDGANAGDTNFRSGKFYCTNVCGVLINSSGYSNYFLAELINSISKKYVSYVGNPKLMNNVMSNIKLKLPCIQEQQKISAFLFFLDKDINLKNEQIDKISNWKNGLLQKMFI